MTKRGYMTKTYWQLTCDDVVEQGLGELEREDGVTFVVRVLGPMQKVGNGQYFSDYHLSKETYREWRKAQQRTRIPLGSG